MCITHEVSGQLEQCYLSVLGLLLPLETHPITIHQTQRQNADAGRLIHAAKCGPV